MTERIMKNSSYLNATFVMLTLTRVKDVSPTSSMYLLCIKERPALCEIGFSAFRGREVLYPSLSASEVPRLLLLRIIALIEATFKNSLP